MIPQLLFDITNCANFNGLINNNQPHHPCSRIVAFQREMRPNVLNQFQLPEPWSGDLLNSPILVISSNPAYSIHELFPTSLWPEAIIADFFINRFRDRGIQYSWVFNNKVLNTDGTRGKSVKYWSSIKNRVEEIFDRVAIPGIDYCITEVVQCKSSSEIGVRSALPTCTNLFLNAKLSISAAKIIIAVGSHIRNYFNNSPEVNGIPIIYLPHPNSFGPHIILNNNVGQIEAFRNRLIKNENIQQEILFSDIQLPNDQAVADFIEQQISFN